MRRTDGGNRKRRRMKHIIRRAAFGLALTTATAGPTRVSGTPYEQYLHVVRTTLSGIPEQRATFTETELLTRIGYGFRYRQSHPYIPRPADEVERTGYGDCKDKALWLATRLGDESIRFVIGKQRAHSRESHAWLEWESGGVTWILDPTIRSVPRDKRSFPPTTYIPLWSYTKSGAWRH